MDHFDDKNREPHKRILHHFPFISLPLAAKIQRANPKSALGILLKVLASDHSKLQLLQSQTDFCGTCGCSVFHITGSQRHDPKSTKLTSHLHPKGHNGQSLSPNQDRSEVVLAADLLTEVIPLSPLEKNI